MQKPTQVVGRRVVATIIDSLILTAIVVGAWFALTKQVPGICPIGGGGIEIGDNCRGFSAASADAWRQTLWFVIIAVALLVMLVLLPGLKGTTPGKSAVGIRIVKDDGSNPGIGRALVRAIFWAIEGWLIALIVALVTERNQRVGDLVASTYVVDKSASAQFGGHGLGVTAGAGGYVPSAPQQFAQPHQGWSGPPQGAQQPQPQQASAKADWYPDPQGQARLRYWDGQSWTEHTSN
jgi:uncharacterized RDD family membrane protein YckC